MAGNTPSQIIDEAILIFDGVDPTDADNADRRLQCQAYLRHIYEYFWNLREWEWTYKEGSVTVLANSNSIALPTDFLEFGSQGSVFDQARKKRLTEISSYRLERYRKQVSNPVLDAFSIFNRKIQLTFTVTSNLVLDLFYRKTAVEIDTDGANLVETPDRYADTILLPGLLMRMQGSKHDARDVWAGMFRDGIAQACVLENPLKTSGQKLPLALRGVW